MARDVWMMFAVEALGYLEDCPCAGIQLLT